MRISRAAMSSKDDRFGGEGEALGLRVHALLLGERITTQDFDAEGVIASAPLIVRIGASGSAALFRYGVAVLIGVPPEDEKGVLEALRPRVTGPVTLIEEETTFVRWERAEDDAVAPGGVIQLRELSTERLSIVADALAKSVALAAHEREVAAFFDSIEPTSQALMQGAAPRGGRTSFLRLVGSALVIQHRVSGRVAAREKPDLLWDRPELERLFARLQAEYELIERAEALDRKLQAVGATASAMIDLQDTALSQRLETLVVILVLVEVAVSLVQLYIAVRH